MKIGLNIPCPCDSGKRYKISFLCILATFMFLTVENVYAEGTTKLSDSSLRVKLLKKIEREREYLLDNNYSEASVIPSDASKERATAPPSDFAYGIKFLLLGAIKFYQAVITKQDGPSCKVSPSCSEWGFEQVKQHHVWGVVLIASRLLRCYRCQKTGCELDSDRRRVRFPR